MATKELILLCGAGFTKNFGGFLSIDMWEQFFNNPNMPEKLKRLMLRGTKGDDDYFNYEDVVQTVLTEDKYKEFGDVIKVVVEAAYKRQENKIDSNITNNQTLVDRLKHFIFTNISLFFTLNQDTFVEKHLHKKEHQILSLPYLTPKESQNGEDAPFQLPKQEELHSAAMPILIGDKFVNYIKLHGSRNWYDSLGKNFPVIGKNKRDLIEKEPLLKAYFDFFDKSLNSGKKMLVIGYSFLDKHINESISNGIEKGMRLFVVDAISAKEFGAKMMNVPPKGATVLYNISDSHRKLLGKIWNGLSGYLQINNIEEFIGNETDGVRQVFPVLFN